MLVLTSNTTFVITRLDDKLDHKTSYKYKKKRKEKKKSNSLLTSNEQVATKVSVICCIPIIFRCLMYQN